MTIKRSTGLYTGYLGYMCGSGYEGLTKELDTIVEKQAELLAETFNYDVEIRFNSDRESGGAWLKNSLQGFAGNCQVGFGARLRPIRPESMIDDNYWESWRTLPKELCIDTYVEASALKDHSLANSGNPDSRYSSLDHKSVKDALAWLVDNIDTNKILS